MPMLLVLDATTGQNALSQAEMFAGTAGVTGLIMTKLDGTARGGILVAIADKFRLPVHAIGVGEGLEDLQPFNAEAFSRAIAGLKDAPAMTNGNAQEGAPKLSSPVRLLIEIGPLVAFFLANARSGIFVGTAVYMVTAAVALAVNWWLTRKVAIMPIITLGFVLVFGILTLALQDDVFIKMKVTIINAMFGIDRCSAAFISTASC